MALVMGVISLLSAVVAVAASLALWLFRSQYRKGEAKAVVGYWYSTVVLIVAMTSAVTSLIYSVIHQIWIYSITVGVVLGLATIYTYKIRQKWGRE